MAGRALERLAHHADQIASPLVLAAVRLFKLDVSQVHYDITGVELFGAYELEAAEKQAPPTPLLAYGRTKSGWKNVKQVQLGLNVSGDGGVPLLHTPLDGNAPETPTHLDNLRRLRQLLPRQNLPYVADTKLDTPENLLTVKAGEGQFLCGGVFSPQLQEVYLAHRGERRSVGCHPKSQERLAADKRDRYRRQQPHIYTDTVRLLRQWLREVDASPESPLLPNARGRPMTRSGIEHRLRVAVQRAAVIDPSLLRLRISPHTIRHTTAMHLLQSGIDLSVIAMWLGHESIETTHQYLDADLESKRRALERLNAPKLERPLTRAAPPLIQFLKDL